MTYKNRVFGLLFGLLFAGAVCAETVSLNPNHPEKYTVVQGDTLWAIAGQFLNNPWQWPEIWHINPQIENPHLIFPGDTISLIMVDGKPRLMVTRNVKLSPHARITALDSAIPTIPIDAIRQFLSRPRVLAEGEFEKAPYIVAFADDRLVAGMGYSGYVRSIETANTESYTVLRKGKKYVDPASGETLGYEAQYVATAKLKKTGDPATVLFTNTNHEVIRGDRMLPTTDEVFPQNFYPKKPVKDINGHILSILTAPSLIGQYDIVAISVGAHDGVEVGHVLAADRVGKKILDNIGKEHGNYQVTLPDEDAGTMMVFRVFDRVSYALVMTATRVMHENDKVRTP